MIASERIEKFLTQTRAAVTRTSTGMTNAEPAIYEHEGGSTTEIHPRSVNSDRQTFVQLWDGRIILSKYNDMVIQSDRAGNIFECVKMKDVPKDVVVFGVSLLHLSSIPTRTNEKGEVFRSYQIAQGE